MQKAAIPILCLCQIFYCNCNELTEINTIDAAQDGKRTLTLMQQKNIDILIFSICVPAELDMVKKIIAHHAKVQILILAAKMDDILPIRFLHLGVAGYLIKDCSFDELRAVIQWLLAFLLNIALYSAC